MLRPVPQGLLPRNHNQLRRNFAFVCLMALMLLPFSVMSVAAEPSQLSMSQPEAPSPRVMQLWATSCALCHVDGTAGAPVIGDRDAWLPRQQQGFETLLRHTVEGFNDMPPLGYCMACEREDFLRLIEFMTGEKTNRQAKP